jgi:hypothetical protein
LSVEANRLGSFLREGQVLRARLVEDPLPIGDHNAWVERMNAYFAEQGADAYAVRLSDFSGMTFYGDGSQRSRISNSIDGRCRRLHEFIGEVQRNGVSAPAAHGGNVSESPILILKPTFFGFGVDLRAGWKRVSKWLRNS